jgi:plastocyanin
MTETLFYICGIALAVSAVVVSLLGLKLKDFPGKAMPVVVLWFAILVGAATTFAVLHAKDEDKEKAAEFREANKEIEKETSTGPFEGPAESGVEGGGEPRSSVKGPGGTLQLAADPTELKFDKTELTSKPGVVTIDFDNPAPLEHNVAVEKEGKELGVSELIAEAKTSVTVELEPGTYTFLCTVPGHAEAGMEGKLVVK